MQKYILVFVSVLICASSLFAQQSKITVKGSVVFPDNKFNINIFYRDNGEKIIVDTLELNADNTFKKIITLPAPGVYTINCQNWEAVNFWGENEDVEINFRGQDTASVKIKNPPYRHIKSSGKNNELMNWVNFFDYRNYQAMIEAGKEISAAKKCSSDDWKVYAANGYNEVNSAGEYNINYLAKHYSHLSSAVSLLTRIKDEEVKNELVSYLDTHKADYAPFVKYKKEIALKAERMRKVEEGAAAPVFTYFLADDSQKENLKQFEGKYLLIDFWASWCGPCRRSIPGLKELYAKYESKGFEIISVSVDEKKTEWMKALAEEKMPWTQAHTLKSGREVMGIYQFNSIPFLVLVDKEGMIVKRGIAMTKLIEMLEELL